MTDSESKLHTAICQAVAILNVAPEIARISEGRQAHTILRQALAEYADDYMEQPVTKAEHEAIALKHRSHK